MFPGEKQCLCTKTRIILTPWRDDVQPCDVQVKSLALKLAPTSKGWLESVLSWAHKSQPRIDVQIHLFYFSRKSISGKSWLIVRHQVITTIVLLKFTKQRAWAAMESTLWVKLCIRTCSLGFYGPSAHTTPSFRHACLVRTSSSVERPRPSLLHLFFNLGTTRGYKSSKATLDKAGYQSFQTKWCLPGNSTVKWKDYLPGKSHQHTSSPHLSVSSDLWKWMKTALKKHFPTWHHTCHLAKPRDNKEMAHAQRSDHLLNRCRCLPREIFTACTFPALFLS